jgi:hypothetical protein
MNKSYMRQWNDASRALKWELEAFYGFYGEFSWEFRFEVGNWFLNLVGKVGNLLI